MSGSVSAKACVWAIAIGASISVVVRADEPSSCNPEMWKEAIADFEQEDAKEPPPKGGIVFVGSSSIRLWDVKKSFPEMPVINRGFGGSQICDATHYVEQLVVKHQPRVVVFYAGDNDIAAGKSPEQVQEDFRKFVETAGKSLPEARIVFISIKPSIARWKLADKMREANKLIREEHADNEQVEFVDVWGEMLDADGNPRKDLLRDDNLHLNDAGYAVWNKLVSPHLERKDEE